MKHQISISIFLSFVLTVGDWIGTIKSDSKAMQVLAQSAPTTVLGWIEYGNVQIKRQGWSNYHSARVETLLYSGDLLQPVGNSKVRIRCSDQTLQVLPNGVPSSINNFCQPESEPFLSGSHGILYVPPRGDLLTTEISKEQQEEVRIISQKIVDQQLSLEIKALFLADLYSGYGLIAKAIEELEVSVIKESKNAVIYTALGNLYFQSRKFTKSGDLYLKAIALATLSEDEVGLIEALDGLNKLGRWYFWQGDYTSANDLLLKGLVMAKNEAVKYDLLVSLASVRLKQSRYDEAQEYLQQAIATDNSPSAAHCLLAQVMENLSNKTVAESEQKRCRVQKPNGS